MQNGRREIPLRRFRSLRRPREGSLRDFRHFVSSVAKLGGGVYMNCGSAVVLPEVFLKAVSLARNQLTVGLRKRKPACTAPIGGFNEMKHRSARSSSATSPRRIPYRTARSLPPAESRRTPRAM